uniref:methyl-accepting chemotaxis protein n=1 Tax=Anaerosporobacter sp. TaxID=1872529 RepID=UPI0028998FD7
MKSLKTKVIVPLLLLAIIGIGSSFIGLRSLKQLGVVGNDIAARKVPIIITLDAISANVEQLQQLLLTHSVMDTKEDKQEVMQNISTSAATLKAYLEKYKELTSDETSYNQLNDIYEEYMQSYKETLSFSTTNNTREVSANVNGVLSELFQKLNDKVQTMIQQNQVDIGLAKGKQDNIYSNAVITAYGVLIIMILVLFASVFVVIKTIIIPTVGYERKLREITKKINENVGDLTQRIPVHTADEVGKLVRGVNLFIVTLQRIMGEIVTSSMNLDQTFYNANESISKANEDSGDISATMEEVAATMDNVSQTINGINESTASVGESVNKITGVTRNIHVHTTKMKQRAEDLEKTAVSNKYETNNIMENVLKRLDHAIENSQSVARVD